MSALQGAAVSAAKFNEIYSAYGDDVLRLSYFYLADRQKAEDVTQDVFVRYLTRGGEIQAGKEKAWLMVTAVNRCRDLWRSAWVKRVVHGDEVLLSIPAEADDSLENREEQEAVLRAVHKLPPDFREVVLLFYYQNLTIEQIADSMGISKGTAASRLARGRDKVKKLLKEEGYDG